MVSFKRRIAFRNKILSIELKFYKKIRKYKSVTRDTNEPA